MAYNIGKDAYYDKRFDRRLLDKNSLWKRYCCDEILKVSKANINGQRLLPIDHPGYDRLWSSYREEAPTSSVKSKIKSNLILNDSFGPRQKSTRSQVCSDNVETPPNGYVQSVEVKPRNILDSLSQSYVHDRPNTQQHLYDYHDVNGLSDVRHKHKSGVRYSLDSIHLNAKWSTSNSDRMVRTPRRDVMQVTSRSLVSHEHRRDVIDNDYNVAQVTSRSVERQRHTDAKPKLPNSYNVQDTKMDLIGHYLVDCERHLKTEIAVQRQGAKGHKVYILIGMDQCNWVL